MDNPFDISKHDQFKNSFKKKKKHDQFTVAKDPLNYGIAFYVSWQ